MVNTVRMMAVDYGDDDSRAVMLGYSIVIAVKMISPLLLWLLPISIRCNETRNRRSFERLTCKKMLAVVPASLSYLFSSHGSVRLRAFTELDSAAVKLGPTEMLSRCSKMLICAFWRETVEPRSSNDEYNE